MRKIIHVDMDAFYAAIEQRDRPELRGKPVIVGGDPDKRGVVATCSYEARRFGVRSAIPSWRAKQLCPRGVFVRPRMDAYRAVSQQIHAIFAQYTDLVEPVAFDEAYLDVTRNHKQQKSATLLAQELKWQIFKETGLTASAGVSFNKFLAKVASDWNKPNGLTVVTPEIAPEFIDTLPISVFRGVGKVTEEKMHALGIHTGADLKAWRLIDLCLQFGRIGQHFYNMAHCLDERPVQASRVRKSYGRESTLEKDVRDRESIEEILREIAAKLERSLRKSEVRGRTITLKLRYPDFQTVTRSRTLALPVSSAEQFLPIVLELLDKTEVFERGARLLGITLSQLDA